MKKLLALIVAVAAMISCSTATLASASNEDISVLVNYDITVTYNGKLPFFQDANGKAVYPLSYNDTTYLPVRAVSEMLGLGVQWNQETQTITLASGAEIKSNENGERPTTASYTASATLNKVITVLFDGNTQSFYDANHVQVYPISFENTTYLPIRALSNMLNVPVEWIQSEQRVALGVGEYEPVAPPVTSNGANLLDYSYKVVNDAPDYYNEELSVVEVNGGKVIRAVSKVGATLLNMEEMVFTVDGYEYIDFVITNSGTSRAVVTTVSHDGVVNNYRVESGESVAVKSDILVSSGSIGFSVSVYQQHANAMDVTLSDFNLHN